MVTHELLEFFCLGKTALHGSVPYKRIVHVDLEGAARAGDKRDFAQVLTEGAQQFLGVPARPQKPAALHTEVDLDAGANQNIRLLDPSAKSSYT